MRRSHTTIDPLAECQMGIRKEYGFIMMAHPTVYENLKVAIENYIYDLDNQGEGITVTHRADLLDMAVMSRRLELQFALIDQPYITAELQLSASLKDLADEILEQTDDLHLCSLQLRFRLFMPANEQSCERISQLLRGIWGSEVELELTVIGTYDPVMGVIASNQIIADVRFDRKIGEAQIEDIPELVSHMLRTLYRLETI